jgi:hypothetical protein
MLKRRRRRVLPRSRRSRDRLQSIGSIGKQPFNSRARRNAPLGRHRAPAGRPSGPEQPFERD